jgi:hypothetical protein
MAKIRITNSSFTNVGTAYKISSDVNLEADANAYNNIGTVLDVSPADMPESMRTLISLLHPLGATPEEIGDALLAVRNAAAEDRVESVENSTLWQKVKGKFPDAAALLIKTAVEFWKLNV